MLHEYIKRKCRVADKDSEPRRDNPSLSCSYLNEKYGGEGKYVPARIVALYKDPLTGIDKAMVQACHPRMILNEKRSSIITESWHLQSEKDTDDDSAGFVPLPLYNQIDESEFIDRIRVYMEFPRFDHVWLDHESSGHVILVAKRSEHWAKQFLDHHVEHE